MMRRYLAVLLVLCTLGSLCACGAQPTQTEYSPGDNRLVIYTSHKQEIVQPIVREFEERTGIWVQIISGGTNELLDRIAAEGNDPQADVMFGGGGESLQACSGYFQPYASPELEYLLPQYREEDRVWLPFSSLPIVLIYNSKLLSAGQLTGWNDLLSGSLQGEIAFADPALSGSCFTAAVTAGYVCGNMEETMQTFARQLGGEICSSSGDILTAVEEGRKKAGVTLEETALKQLGPGSDLVMVYPREGTSCIPDGVAVIRNAKHSENARRFVDFVLSKDVQQLLARELFRRSVRSDVSADPALPEVYAGAAAHYSIEWASANREKLLSQWAFWFGQED